MGRSTGSGFVAPSPLQLRVSPRLESGTRSRYATMCASTATKESTRRGPQPRVFGQPVESETRPPRVRNPKKRVRQHVNPLAIRWQGSVSVDSAWFASSYADPTLPLFVDVGCGKGRFLESMSLSRPDMNYLGLEIRSPLVDDANARCDLKQIRNLRYLACNANVSLSDVLAKAPSGVVMEIAAQFADPWFKKRHAKRRMVDPPLVGAAHDALRAACRFDNTGAFCVQTDVRPLAVIMRGICDAHSGLVMDPTAEWDKNGWMTKSPYQVQTEREICVLRKGGTVYRARYVLNPSADWDAGGVWDQELLEEAVGEVARLAQSDDEGEVEQKEEDDEAGTR